MSPEEKDKNDKKRFVYSKKTIQEFNLKANDIPIGNRKDMGDDFISHVDNNVKMTEKFNEMNKVLYLSKIKFNAES